MPQNKIIADAMSAGTGFAPDEPVPGTGPWVPGDSISTEVARSGWGRRLQRTTSSGRFIPEVDGLRFVAILSVLIFHISAQVLLKSKDALTFSSASKLFLPIANQGHIGVQLFFAISGFILALPFAAYYLKSGKPVSLRSYYLRRLTRLEPPYIITLIIFFVLIILVLKSSLQETLAHFLASAFYLHNLIYAKGSSINFVAWSLEVEVQFYLLAPFLALLFRVRPHLLRRLLFVGLMGAFLLLQLFTQDVARVRLSILGQGQFFLVGFLLADLYLTDWSENKSRPLMWDIVFFVGWPLFFVLTSLPGFYSWLIPFFIFVLYAATFRGNWGRRLLSLPLLTIIGGMCYSIYLIHFQIIALIWRVSAKANIGSDFISNFILQFCLMTPIILAISTLFYMIVERPCMSKEWPAQLVERIRAKHG